MNETRELIHVFVNGEEIITTPSHPFYSPEKGWIAAGMLQNGDILFLSNKDHVIVENVVSEILKEPVTVYNFQVEGYHTYFVGNSSILVHNTCVKSKAKKIVPELFEKQYGLDAGTFHREIKPTILSKVKPNYKVGSNPDILMDKAKNIAYQGTNGYGFQDTGLNMIEIFKELGK